MAGAIRILNWIFSGERKSVVNRGMPKSKNGRSMGGKDRESTSHRFSDPHPRPMSHQNPSFSAEKNLLQDSNAGAIRGAGGGGTAGADSSAAVDDNASSSSGSSSSNSTSHKCSKGDNLGEISKKKLKKRLRHASTTDTDNDGSESSSTLEREAPDGGWGWVVVGAAFFVNLIADGVTFSFGGFYTEFSDVFGESKSTTAWVGSLLAAMPLLSGPIASSLTDRFGCRKVTICGGLLSALGFILSSYATSIYMLMFTFGIITGFGLSLCYVAAVVIVAYYFERRRSFATGLSVCGGGIGTFIFAPLIQYLNGLYGWRDTTMILSGAFLNLCVCGLLMRDLEWTKKNTKKRDKLLQNEHDFNTQAQLNLLAHGDLGSHSLEGNSSMAVKNERLCNSALCIPTFVQEQERRGSRRIRYYSSNYGNPDQIPTSGDEDDLKKQYNKPPKVNSNINLTQMETEKDKKDIRETSPSRNVNGLISVTNANSNSCCNSPLTNNPTLIQFNSSHIVKTHSNNSSSNNNLNYDSGAFANTNNTGSNGVVPQQLNSTGEREPTTQQKQQAMRNYVVHNTRNWPGRHRHSLTYRGAVLSLKRYRLRPASSCPDIISVATTDDRGAHEWKAVLADIYVWMRGVFAWENLANSRFILFIMSNFLLYMWYDIPYMFLADSTQEGGYTKAQGSYLGATIGICNVFGNVILGYIGDKKWANSIMVYGICISICGVVTALMAYFITVNYYVLNVLCGLFGVMIAANYSLTSVILVKVVSLERFANAYGLLLLIQGIGNLIGPPIAGVLYDWTGTYAWSFLIAGGGIFVSNFFILGPIYNHKAFGDKNISEDRNDSQA